MSATEVLRPDAGGLKARLAGWALARAGLGFVHAACGPMVRSSYHADRQAHEAGIAP